MYDYYFTFPTLTASQQALMILRRSGISADLVKIPLSGRGSGCTNGLGLISSSAIRAAAALRQAAMAPSGMFRREPTGWLREVWL